MIELIENIIKRLEEEITRLEEVGGCDEQIRAYSNSLKIVIEEWRKCNGKE